VVATDGDLDVVNVARRNIAHNTKGCQHVARAGQLPWGSGQRLAQLGLPRVPVDAVLLSDVVYGSDPSVWRQLVGCAGLRCCTLASRGRACAAPVLWCRWAS
jgi:hypothetical protein